MQTVAFFWAFYVFVSDDNQVVAIININKTKQRTQLHEQDDDQIDQDDDQIVV